MEDPEKVLDQALDEMQAGKLDLCASTLFPLELFRPHRQSFTFGMILPSCNRDKATVSWLCYLQKLAD